jgi:hypothetical protein
VTNFYLASAAAAATLVGLLFVAVQIGPPLVGAGPIDRRHAMARSTFSIFATLFALSLFLVLPDQSSRVRALVVIAAGAVGAYRTVRTWIPVWADKLQGRIEFRLLQTAWLLVGLSEPMSLWWWPGSSSCARRIEDCSIAMRPDGSSCSS